MKLSDLNCKALLCDTCVLIELVRIPKSSLESFLKVISDSHIVLQIEDIIMTEFLRGAKNYQQAQDSIDLITALLASTFDPNNYLPTCPTDMINAQIISNINNNIDPNYSGRASLADNVIIAKMSKISSVAGLCFATFNHQDFIPPIMERVTIVDIEAPKRVLPLGIYRVNHAAYQKLKIKFGY